MTLKTLTIALVCATAQAGYSISSMLTSTRRIIICLLIST